MTLSVIYFHDDKIDSNSTGIRCCADSLITGILGKMTPHAMKILKLNLNYEPFSFITKPHPIINPSLGFTFAGNLNVAMITYALMSHLCEHMQPLPGYENTFPSIKSIANLTARALHSYTSNYSALLEEEGFVKIILFGYCTQEQDFKAFYIYPVIEDHLALKVEEIKIRELPYFAIGTGKSLLDKKYEEVGKFSPKLVRDIINDQASEDAGVGGYFQRGWSNKAGIQLYCDLMNVTPKGLEFPFCGFNLAPLNLGTHIITLPAHAFE